MAYSGMWSVRQWTGTPLRCCLRLPSPLVGRCNWCTRRRRPQPSGIRPGTPQSASRTSRVATSDADVTGDGTVDEDNALVMYYAYRRGDLLGDGEQGGDAESRQRLLGGLSGGEEPWDETLRGMLRRANAWRSGEASGDGDINGDGELDADEALAMHHAYWLEDLLSDGEEGGTAHFRQRPLGGLAGEENPSDAVLRGMLRKANAIRNPDP